jgi:hypothetical protein
MPAPPIAARAAAAERGPIGRSLAAAATAVLMLMPEGLCWHRREPHRLRAARVWPVAAGIALGLSSLAAATPADAAPGGVHRLTAELNALGAVSCLARVEQVARFLDPGNVAAVAVMPLGSYPNQRLILANLAIPQTNGREALATVTIAPNQANGCGASYQLIKPEAGNCTAALKARQAEPRGAIALGGKAIRIQRLSQDSAFLGWQLKDSCLIIKQQTLLN